MPLHPQAQMFCDVVNANPVQDETLEMARTGFAMLVQMTAGEPEPVYAIEDRDADGVPVRVYRPAPDAALPVVVFFHGGGFTIGSVEHYDPVARRIANASDAIVVSVDYRLAPEHPFPAAIDDCWHALQWTAANAASFGGDPARIAVMGDSAGGNLAAVCALQARDAGAPALTLQVLVYPVTDCDFTTASYADNGEGFLLDQKRMRWFLDNYAPAGVDRSNWRLAPLRAADLRGVAPAVVVTAEFDPLRDEGDQYADRLADAGVTVQHERFDGMIHMFFAMYGVIDASTDALTRVGTALQRAFGTVPA